MSPHTHSTHTRQPAADHLEKRPASGTAAISMAGKSSSGHRPSERDREIELILLESLDCLAEQRRTSCRRAPCAARPALQLAAAACSVQRPHYDGSGGLPKVWSHDARENLSSGGGRGREGCTGCLSRREVFIVSAVPLLRNTLLDLRSRTRHNSNVGGGRSCGRSAAYRDPVDEVYPQRPGTNA